MTAAEIMTREVLTVRADAPLREAMATMVRGRVSGLPVVEGTRVVGILTEGDLVRRLRHQVPWFTSFVDGTVLPPPPVEPEGLHELLERVRATPVREVMTRDVVVVRPDAEIEEVAETMTHRRLKRVPVVDGGRLVGIVSRGDLVRGMLQG